MRSPSSFSLVIWCVLQILLLASTQAAQTAGSGEGFSSDPGQFITPAPPYPFIVDGDTRQWTANVAFDAHGNATAAVIIRSTGSPALDSLISTWIRGHWKSPNGRPTTLVTSAK